MATTAWTQAVSTSQIKGTIQDTTGAAIPGAQVKLIQTETGAMRATVSGPDGAYLFPNLVIGQYRLEVSKDGFATFVEKGIELNVNTNPTINAVLKVGAVSEQVMVQAEALAVETHSTGVGQIIDHSAVVELPLNAREPTQLILLAGVATTQGTIANDLNTNKNFPTITISVAGANANQISFTLDGGTANNPFNGLNQPLPFPDALQEFKVETSSVGAQTGQHAAASVTVATRSGTNELHGNLFEYTRNYLFNGRSATALTRDSLKQNQFGGTIGGPIIRNRLFFFVGGQGTIKRSNPGGQTGFTMTPAMLEGDFHVVASTACQTRAITLSAPFVNNIIPQSQIDPIGLKLAKLLPTNQINDCGLINYATGANQRQYQFPAKVDYTLNSKHTFFARYMLSNNYTPIQWDPGNPLFTGSTTGQENNITSVVLGETYVITPTVVASTHIGADRGYNPRFVPTFKTPGDLGIPITPFIPAQMTLNITGGPSLGGGASNPGYFNTLVYSASEDVTIVRGKHQLQVGGQYMRAYMHAQNTRGVNGNLNFTGQYSTVGGTTGLGYADLVTGRLNNFGQGRPFYDNDKSDYYGLYAQDAWRIGPHLSLNLGLRFEPYLPQRNTDGYVEAFDMGNFLAGKIGTPPVASPVLTPPAGLIFPGDPGYPPNNQYNNKANHWLPRVGVVWDPFGDGKTSIRASYGLLYDTPHMFFYTRVSNNPPWGATLTRTGGPFPLSNPWDGYPGGDPFVHSSGTAKSYGFFPTGGVYAVSDPNLKSPQVSTWNLSIQRQMGSWLLSASYLGNHTAHLWSSRELNPQVYIPGNCQAEQYGLTAAGPCSNTTGGNTAARRLLTLANPTWGPWYSTIAYLDAGATSSYNGMLLSAQHRLGNHFSMLGNWTWSHCIADPSTTELTGPSYVDPNNRAADRSSCSADHRQQVNISGILTSPHMTGRVLGLLVNGWQASPIFHWSTGNLTTATYGTDVALTGAANQRAQQILPNVYGDGSITNYLNINAFLAPASAPKGEYATTRPFTITGPNVMNIDLALSRTFQLRERHKFTFRAEAFNLPNSVMFGPPTAALNSNNFGRLNPQIQSTAPGTSTTARIMQFALKYQF
ncbi:MAG TPA: carboxypeptidase regulatory-like domain-containing protein [Bryobacteraceae bacterium]